jgi:hypothetical protein
MLVRSKHAQRRPRLNGIDVYHSRSSAQFIRSKVSLFFAIAFEMARSLENKLQHPLQRLDSSPSLELLLAQRILPIPYLRLLEIVMTLKKNLSIPPFQSHAQGTFAYRYPLLLFSFTVALATLMRPKTCGSIILVCITLL